MLVTNSAPSQDSRLAELSRWSKVVFKPKREAVLSSQIHSTVVRISKSFGDTFNTGELLVELDPIVFEAAVHQARAALAAAEGNLACEVEVQDKQLRIRRAEAAVQAAQANLEVTGALRRDNNASKVDLEAAKRDHEIALVDLAEAENGGALRVLAARRDAATAESNLRVAQKELEGCRVLAPFDGRVVEVIINEHEMVRRGDPLVQLVDDRILIASFLLPESAFHRVKVGQELRIHAESQDLEPIAARITHIAATVDPGSRTFEVRAEIDNTAGRLRAGMGGRVALEQFGVATE